MHVIAVTPEITCRKSPASVCLIKCSVSVCDIVRGIPENGQDLVIIFSWYPLAYIYCYNIVRALANLNLRLRLFWFGDTGKHELS